MRYLHAVLLLCLAACSAPRQYERGAYVPVPAPTPTRPGVGAPTFDPRHKPAMQPQPKPARPLPETPESRRGPGLWGATPPRASGEAGPTPELFDWNVPLPEDEPEAAAKIKACAEIMKVTSPKALHRHDLEQFDRINIAWRQCWPHAAIVRCLDGLKQETSAMAERETLQRAGDFARKAVADTCSGGTGMWSPGFMDRLNTAWGAR